MLFFRAKKEPLTDDNFLLMAARWYDKTTCARSEFEHDCKRIKYLKKLFKKYKKTGEMKERLALNHIIILGNVFGVEHSIRMLYLKIDSEDWDILKTFLLSIDQNPKIVYSINGVNIDTAGIPVNLNIADRLRVI